MNVCGTVTETATSSSVNANACNFLSNIYSGERREQIIFFFKEKRKKRTSTVTFYVASLQSLWGMSTGVTGRETAAAHESGGSSCQNNGCKRPLCAWSIRTRPRSARENSEACPLLQMICGEGWWEGKQLLKWRRSTDWLTEPCDVTAYLEENPTWSI